MEEVLDILEKFDEYFSITNPITYMLRLFGWYMIKGLSWLVDSLANITDTILGIKVFFDNPNVDDLVDFLLPVSTIMMALSLAWIGYLFIFRKKVDREAIVVNVFLVLVILTCLGTAMQKANKFTNEAVEAIDVNSTSSVSEKIVKDNLTDLVQFDLNGWETTKLEEPNKIAPENILKVDITQKIDEDFELSKGELSETGKNVFKNRIVYDDAGGSSTEKLENGLFTAIDQNYYRWDWNFWTIFLTLGVMGFTMVTIAVKMAKLFFELTFNYILALIVAPADIRTGQRTKQIIQNILNVFLVTIMIFLSLKIYTLGTTFLANNLDGVSYVIALIGFSAAVIDGPSMVERLFGIDAGMKSGWRTLAGTYALAKGTGSLAQGAVDGVKNAKNSLGNNISKDSNKQSQSNQMANVKSAMSGQMNNQSNISGNEKNANRSSEKNESQSTSTEPQNPTNQETQSTGMEDDNTGQASEKTPSVHEEMAQNESNQNQANAKNTPMSLYDEMKKKGYNQNFSSMKSGQKGQTPSRSKPSDNKVPSQSNREQYQANDYGGTSENNFVPGESMNQSISNPMSEATEVSTESVEAMEHNPSLKNNEEYQNQNGGTNDYQSVKNANEPLRNQEKTSENTKGMNSSISESKGSNTQIGRNQNSTTKNQQKSSGNQSYLGGSTGKNEETKDVHSMSEQNNQSTSSTQSVKEINSTSSRESAAGSKSENPTKKQIVETTKSTTQNVSNNEEVIERQTSSNKINNHQKNSSGFPTNISTFRDRKNTYSIGNMNQNKLKKGFKKQVRKPD
ncbi:pLS20_p028 family conjugation system transmembrane protein [Halobacillus litoralis]|uniref:pLS20_p028 family conjugation system transmembrane protein n=1 Tax=Halobacillus litoralis TaxID=45668 RepID=UPI001CD3C5EC|nr:hypothetical protein [Halobacillus litoralis]MCA1024440.1 hypothetical protein [Halobacillus litoralis]